MKNASEVKDLIDKIMADYISACNGKGLNLVRKPISIAANGITMLCIASDGTMWEQTWEGDDMIWTRLPNLPQD
jgi:hypothetical protein